MPNFRRIATVIAVGLCPGVLALGCGSSGSKAATTTTSTAPSAVASVATPKVGECLEPLTPPMASSAQMPARVPCDQPHGGEIISIVDLGGGAGAAYPAMRRTIGDGVAAGKCQGDGHTPGEIDRFAGDNHLDTSSKAAAAAGVHDAWMVSGVDGAAYVPGPAQWARGARWMVCAAVLDNNAEAPASYSGSIRGVRSARGQLAVPFAWCKHTLPDSDINTFTVVSCDRPHNYEQLASFSYGAADAAFPGDKVIADTAAALCHTLSSAATGGKSDSMPKGFGLSWSFPGSRTWADGDHIGRCYAITLDGLSTGTIGFGSATAAH